MASDNWKARRKRGRVLLALAIGLAWPAGAAAQQEVDASRIYLGVTGSVCLVSTGSGAPTGGNVCDRYTDVTTGITYEKRLVGGWLPLSAGLTGSGTINRLAGWSGSFDLTATGLTFSSDVITGGSWNAGPVTSSGAGSFHDSVALVASGGYGTCTDRVGSGIPASGLGADCDTYRDVTNDHFYVKLSGTWHNLSDSTSGFVETTASDASAGPYALALLDSYAASPTFLRRDEDGGITYSPLTDTLFATVTGGFTLAASKNVLINPNGTAARYVLVDEPTPGTYAGSVVLQAGEGGAAYGGAISVFGHAHATKPGWVTAGISSGSGGKFTVNSQALGGGTDVFTVDAAGNVVGATFTGSGSGLSGVPASALPNAAADGATKGVATFTAADFNATAGVIALDYTNGQAASGSTKGFLSATDWTTFNSKQAAGNYITALTGDVTASGPGSATTAIAAGVIVDADVNASAAIGWSKINKTGSSLADLATRSAGDLSSGTLPGARMPALTGDVTMTAGTTTTAIAAGVIVDADVNASAAIGWSKISKTGSSLADLATRSAGDLSSGTLADARLSSNVPLKNGTNAFTGTTTFLGGVGLVDAGGYGTCTDRVGSGIPASGLGADCDTYRDVTNDHFYVKLAGTWHNLSDSTSGFVETTASDASAGPYALALLDSYAASPTFLRRDEDGGITYSPLTDTLFATVTGGFTLAAAKNVLINPNGTAARYVLVDEPTPGTYAGSVVLQAGEGGAAYGGAINLFGHAHATKPGWVTAGISSGSGGKFTVNSQALGGGTDVFTVDASGNVVGTAFTGSGAGLTSLNASNLGSGTVPAARMPALTGDVTMTAGTTTTAIAAGVIVNADINASAGIVDTKLATIATAGKVSNSATTATSANTASAIVARDASGNFSAGTITATLSGNASTATSATNATNVGITNDTTTNATMYPLWVTTTTGNLPAKVSSTKLTFNPSTGVLAATGFSGPLTGAVTGNVSGTASSFTGNLTGDVTSTGMATAIAAGVIVDADVNASAAIGWSKINKTGSSLADLATRSAGDLSSGTLPGARMPALTGDVTMTAGTTTTAIAAGVIVDADVNASAAIGWSKISKTGSSLADLATRSAGDLSSGTLADARLSSNVPLKNGTNAFTGTTTFLGGVGLVDAGGYGTCTDRVGSGIPASGLGADCDTYRDVTNDHFYVKLSGTWHNLSDSTSGFVETTASDASAGPYALALLDSYAASPTFLRRDEDGGITYSPLTDTLFANVTGGFTLAAAKNVLINPNGTAVRYVLVDEPTGGTYAGQLVMQAGEGSAGYGGAINLFGHAHATKPGWVTAGISSGSGGKFTVNSQALGGGTDVFTVDASGNVDLGLYTDITPDATGAGQLQVFGHGYTGFLALDLSAMYVGHNSAVRRLDLMTNETTRLAVGGSGDIAIGGATASRSIGGFTPRVMVEGLDVNGGSLSLITNANSVAAPYVWFGKSRGTALGQSTIVQDGDTVGGLVFSGADGADLGGYNAFIAALVDGTPGVNDLPGRLAFYTTADGANTSTERMRIRHNGNTGWMTTDVETWHSSYPGFHFGGQFAIMAGTATTGGSTYLNNGLYDDAAGTWKYRNSADDEGSTLGFSNGAAYWYTSPAGVNDASATLTLRMAWGNTGNVGIGPDMSPDYLLDVQGTFNADGNSSVGGTLAITGVTYPLENIIVGAGGASLIGKGLTGTYDATKFRPVYAMGAAYDMLADGTGLDNFYGIFYAYDSTAGCSPGPCTYQNVTGWSLGHGFGLASAGTIYQYVGTSGTWSNQITYMQGASAGAAKFATLVAGDTVARWAVNTDGQTEWGPGNAARDTNLYRSAANTLKTDDAFVAALGIQVTGGAFAVGSLYKSATYGLVNAGVTGSTADWAVVTPGGTAVAYLAAGTSGFVFTGAVTAASFSGSGASLTSIPETAITDGSILARVAANETVTGNWYFSTYIRAGADLSGASNTGAVRALASDASGTDPSTITAYRGFRAQFSSGFGVSLETWYGGVPTSGLLSWSAGTASRWIDRSYNSTLTTLTGELTIPATTNPALTIGNGSVGYLKVGASGWYDDGTYLSPLGSRPLYIRSATSTTYIYSPAIYLGSTSGTDVYLRGNAMAGNAWSIATTGVGTFAGGVFNGHLTPGATDTYNAGSPTALWKGIYASQINAIVFAETTATLFGGYSIVGKNAGTFAGAVSSGATTVNFGKTMTVGNWVLVRAHDTSGTVKAEYMTVGSLVSGTTYNVTRDLAGAHGTDPAWAQGTAFLVLGGNGDGRVEINAYDTPRLSVIKQGAAYNSQTEYVRLGYLDSFLSIPAGKVGFAVGDASQYLTYYDGTLTIAGNGSGLTSINGGNIQTGTITATQIAASTITGAKIAAGTITASKIAAGTITATEIAASTITGAKIAAGTITAMNISVSNLSSLSATLGTITAGSVTLGSSGYVRQGQTAYGTGTGFWWGDVSGTPKFSVGVGTTGNRVTFDGADLTIVSANLVADASGVRVKPNTVGSYADLYGFAFGPLSYGGNAGLFSYESASARNLAVSNVVTGTNAASSVLAAANSTYSKSASWVVAANQTASDITGYGNITVYGNFTVADGSSFGHGTGDVTLAATKKVRLDGSPSGDTYIYEQSANTIHLVAGGSAAAFAVASGFGVPSGDSLWVDGGGDTYLIESSANVVDLYAGGAIRQRWDHASGGTTLYGNAVVGAYLNVTSYTSDSPGTALCKRSYDNYIGLCTSLAAYKTDVVDLSLGLDTVHRLRPREFTYRVPVGITPERDLGFVAEEVETVSPLLAQYDGTGDDRRLVGVRYDHMTALLTKALQELAAKVAALEAELLALRGMEKR